ncbi:MAG: hypothetical protein A3F18_07975 [Legionellales bacterium RIFCSPHIGHO2_12_FULL_37_14]|nr:MAG: hypothetical protein A3F18_07975 [Legionellales bacterium RIFCSPHIGHO2_12_FULL_37_14]
MPDTNLHLLYEAFNLATSEDSTPEQEQQRLLEFAKQKAQQAKDYFTKNPTATKMSRKDDDVKLAIAIHIALEVHKLHKEKGYAHLDLKPGNILLENSTPPFRILGE